MPPATAAFFAAHIRARLTRRLPGQRDIKRRQRVFRITRNARRKRFGIATRAGKKAENSTGFGERSARFRHTRHIQSARQKLRISLGFLQSVQRLHQGFQRCQIADPGFVLQRRRIMRRSGE
jgi:hypothetical protein